MNEEIELTLSLAEINQILDALGERPFKSVFSLIEKIQSQATTQMEDG